MSLKNLPGNLLKASRHWKAIMQKIKKKLYINLKFHLVADNCDLKAIVSIEYTLL